jgi:O-antigen/teichoic acid export membrane protein
MIDRKQTRKNAVLTVVQVAVSAICMFAVYKFLLKELGAAKMGVWSIVMAISTVARISDLGFAGGMTKFVAKYRALKDEEAIIAVIDTGSLSIAGLVVFIVAVLYPVALYALPSVFVDARIEDARALLPWSLASFALLAVGGVYLSALDGVQRADLRNLVLIGGTVLYATSIPLFVSRFGFVGLGYAQLLQTAAMMVAGWWVVRRTVGIAGLVPTRWRYARFREMLGYNLNLQFATFASFLGDPLTKVLLGRFGSLAMVGYYEMASKMVSQFRGMVVNVNQVLVPVIAHMNEVDRGEVGNLYRKTYALLTVVSTTFYSLVAIALPLVSQVWIGEYNSFFMTVGYLMLFAMQINTLTGPAYFSNMGTGNVFANSMAQFIIGGTNLALGLLLGWWAGGVGVVVAYALAVTIGSLYLLIGFLLSEGMPLAALLPAGQRGHALACSALVVLSAVVFAMGHVAAGGAKYAVAIVPFVVLIVASLRVEPLRGIGTKMLRRRGAR